MKETIIDFWHEVSQNMDTFIIVAVLQIILLIVIMFLIVSEEKSDFS